MTLSKAMTATKIAKLEAHDLLVELVETPSVSGNEGACAELLTSFFEEHGREAWIDDVGNVRAPGNEILLTSHIDTVPGKIPVEVDDGVLWGRGSVDAKGPLAAMAAAAVETGASFVGVVGEETDSRGARRLVEDYSEPKFVVNGEPSGWDAVTLGYRGFLSGTYSVSVESIHTSRPEPNAIQHAVSWLSAVESAFEPNADSTGTAGSMDESGSVFESVTAKPVSFDGGLAADGLATEAEIEVQFRIPPGTTADEICEIAETELDSGEVSWNDSIPSTMASPRTELARAFRVAIRGEDGDPSLLRKTGTSDANIYAEAWDCPVVTYGPGDSSLDHTPEEHLELAEFDQSVAVLSTVCESLEGKL
ncbi:acetylornithine deacetylase [Haladaptatus litoreus]|uniref:Putative [LysW]-lysine/[LysW]-ornithine hydrolase n=1 Tax=Haladaptatus litoreus TaxID=553468 RepID=A0A1N7BHH7_9EURY|nr:[LysW]-lysine hydrolase [Haladaptatus litoreus]SIR50795.1 acetylornithine deacetylase [Haladaptatus litoreus]